MPRARKTQPVQAAAGQAYGERQAQEQAQQEMPLPASPPGVPAVNPGAGAQEAALGMAPPEPPPWAAGPLDEPITNGLDIGPGPGRAALRLERPKRAPVADMLTQMARATGDPRYAEMAQRAEFT